MSQLKAPNGKPSNLTPEQWKLVRTPQFKAFFGDWENDPENASKVVDENSEPLIVYHYSPNKFTIFDKTKHPQFVDVVENKKHKPLGYDFSTKEGFYESKTRNIKYAVFLSAKNVFDFRNANEKDFEKITKLLSKIPYYSNRSFQLNLDIGYLKSGDWGLLERPTLEKYFSKNYDGLFMKENDWLNVKVYEANQIKLADGSNTTFDGNNPDIRFAEGGSLPKYLHILIEDVNPEKKYFGQYKKIFDIIEEDITLYNPYGTEDEKIIGNDFHIWISPIPDNDKVEQIKKLKGVKVLSNYYAQGGKTKRYMKKIKRGGITYGKSHAEGGIPVKNQSTGDMLEVEGGEGIVNKRSMASKSKVKLNGKDLTICQAVSELNQMEGGVQFSCEDVSDRQFIRAMAKGGELDRGTRTEQEHIQVLKDLYAKRITPKQASERIAKDHLKEDSRYYSKLAKMEGEMAKGGKVKNDYNVPSTEDLVDMVANAREKQIKKVKQSGVSIVIGRNDGYYFKTSDSPNYSEEILSSRPSKRKVIEIIESNPNITEVYFQGSIRGGDYIGDVDFDIVDDFAVLLWKKPIDINNAIGTTFQWTGTEQDPKNENKQIQLDPRVYMLVKQEDAHIYKDRPTDDKYFYLNSYLEKNGEQSAIRIPKSDFQNLIEEGWLETIEVSQALKEQLLKPMKIYAKGGKMADGGKTRKNAKTTLKEAVGFDINSIDISKL